MNRVEHARKLLADSGLYVFQTQPKKGEFPGDLICDFISNLESSTTLERVGARAYKILYEKLEELADEQLQEDHK